MTVNIESLCFTKGILHHIMFLCSLIEELCTKEENDKTGCNFNFGHECILCMFACVREVPPSSEKERIGFG